MTEPNEIESRIGYRFKDKALLTAAFTHSSYVNEHEALSNERIEFLGDCVLNFLVGEKLYYDTPDAKEGALSARRAALVSRAPLARIVDECGLMELLRTGAGVDKSAFSDKARSDLFEALLGAVYLDGGLDACRKVLEEIYFCRVTPERDYKSELKEYCERRGTEPEYIVEQTGDKFCCRVRFCGAEYVGEGKNKRSAQADAARAALAAIQK